MRVRRGFDAHDWDFAQGMDFFQRGAREHGFALVGLEIVFQVELFEEPEDSLRAGLFEPVWGERRVSGWLVEWCIDGWQWEEKETCMACR